MAYSSELIDTLWNVNLSIPNTMAKISRLELIDTLWNVNHFA